MKQYYPRRRPPQNLTIGRLRSLHLASFGDQVSRGMRSTATLGMHEQSWRFIVEFFGARADARKITRERLKRWIARERTGRRGRELSPATIKLRVCTLRAALKVAQREGLIRRLPDFPETAFRYRSRTAWLENFTDYRRILDALPSVRRAYFALLVWTWQHPSDVERMTRDDVDVFCRRPWVTIRNSKNRTLPLRVHAPAELAAVLREGARLGSGLDDRNRLVKPWPARVRTLPAICERLGLPRITATAARHTGISWAIRKLGIAPSVLAWSGHRSPRMVATVYGHALQASLGDVTRALDSMRPRARKLQTETETKCPRPAARPIGSGLPHPRRAFQGGLK